MGTRRSGSTIAAALAVAVALSTTPAAAQDSSRGPLPGPPPGYALGTHSFFTWNGIWIRSGGAWAWRPAIGRDWNAYFRCRAGYGPPSFGFGSHSLWSWLPHRGSSWDLAPGGWMWFPGPRYRSAWNLWFVGPGLGFGGACLGFRPHPLSSYFATGWGGGLTFVGVDARHRFQQPDRTRVTEARRQLERRAVRPIRTAAGPAPAGAAPDRTAPARPRAPEVRFEPVTIDRARREAGRRITRDPLGPSRPESRSLGAPIWPAGSSGVVRELRFGWPGSGGSRVGAAISPRLPTPGIRLSPSAAPWRGADRALGIRGRGAVSPVPSGRATPRGKGRAQ